MEINEELMGQLYKELSRFAGHIVPLQANGDLHAAHECKMAFAQIIADVVLFAVRGGKQRLEGEVGRDRIWDIVEDPKKGKGIGTQGVLVYDVERGDTLIALREEQK